MTLGLDINVPMASRTSGRLTIVANAGRSGSTFLWQLLQANKAANSVFHEDIPVQVSLPRRFNRAYSREDRARVLASGELKAYLDRWKGLLEHGDLIETGWTACHLLPVFQDRLQVVILHRDPWSVALSRANMGNYHDMTWYDDCHEVSPYDPNNIASDYADLWPSMNHAEKCLFWWFVVYKEIDEFIRNVDGVPSIEISAQALFQGNGVSYLSNFLGKPLDKEPNKGRNSVQRFMLETFPISDEHLAFSRHSRVNAFARERFGYEFDMTKLEQQSQKYRLPKGAMPRIRHAIDYWSRRRRLGQAVRSLTGRQ